LNFTRRECGTDNTQCAELQVSAAGRWAA
jgi:hypothetical protein